MEQAGFETAIAADGFAALEMYESYKPDLIVLDLMLPGKDGYDVCKEIRRNSNVPIIMLTAKETELERVLGLELGADDYMTKPFSPWSWWLGSRRFCAGPAAKNPRMKMNTRWATSTCRLTPGSKGQ